LYRPGPVTESRVHGSFYATFYFEGFSVLKVFADLTSPTS
jgi:hypothetical protein